MSDLDARLTATLAEVVGEGHVLTSADDRAPYETDWTRRWSAVELACAHRELPAPLEPRHPAHLLVECADHADPTDALAGALADARTGRGGCGHHARRQRRPRP